MKFDNLSGDTMFLIDNLITVIEKNCLEKIYGSDLSNEEKQQQLWTIVHALEKKSKADKYTGYFGPLFQIINIIGDSCLGEYVVNTLIDKCMKYIENCQE